MKGKHYSKVSKLTQTSMPETKQATVRSVDDRVNYVCKSARTDFSLERKQRANDVHFVDTLSLFTILP